MSLENLNDLDIDTLRKLLKASGRANSRKRKTLCIKIGINEGDLSNIDNLSEDDFVVELIDLLQKRKLGKTIYNLCQEIKPIFKGGEYTGLLEDIIHKLNSSYKPDIQEPILATPGVVEPLYPETVQKLPISSNSILLLRRIMIVSLTITGILLGLRLFGLLEWLELKAFDNLIQHRFITEKEDSRLVIIGITDKDIDAQTTRKENGGGYSLRDPSLSRLLGILEEYHPRLIGLDLYRPFPSDPNVLDLEKRLRKNNIVAVCKVPQLDEEGNPITLEESPPKEVSSIGFSDFVKDGDDILRRHLMAQDKVPGVHCGATESFGFLLAHRYLEKELGKRVNYIDPIKSGENLHLGGTVFPQLQPFTGGYHDVDNRGFQILLNYRATTSNNVAQVFTLEDVFNNKPRSEDIHDKIVLVGNYTNDRDPHDDWYTPYGKLHGVMVHAHAVSQILSAVLDGRPLLSTFPPAVEIVWIWFWSLLGGAIVYYWRLHRNVVIAVSCATLVLYIICLTSITFVAIWIPLVPPALGLLCTSMVMVYTINVESNKQV